LYVVLRDAIGDCYPSIDDARRDCLWAYLDELRDAALTRSESKRSEPSAYLFNGHAFTPNLLTSDQRARAVPLYAITPSHGGERSMPAMTDTLLSEMIEAWFAEHPVEPYIKREDEPEFFKRVERVYRAVERRMTPSATRESAPPWRAEWDGWIVFGSDCRVNGVDVKAGTSWGPFEKSRDIHRSESTARKG
jgi:hypothetical protein